MTERRWKQHRRANKLKYSKMETETESVTREFDDEQYKLTEEQEEEEDTDLQTMERANKLSEHYEHVKDRTVDDDTVLGKLEDIHTAEANDNIIIEVDVPAKDRNERFRFKDPSIWTDEYRFVRWIRHYGYDADNFPNMLQDHCHVKVKREENEYELFIPEGNGTVGQTDLGSYLDGIKDKFHKTKRVYKYSDEGYMYASGYLMLSWLLMGVAFMTELLPFPMEPLPGFGLWFIVTVLIIMLHYAEYEWKDQNGKRF